MRPTGSGPPLGERAVVIGASIAGLLAARVLAEFYEKVTVIDRDTLPPGAEGRRGVPQGDHVHGFQIGGQVALEQLLPGIRDAMIEDGAPTFSSAEFEFTVHGHRLAPDAPGEFAILASRPFFESHIRRRVGAAENVELCDRCEALDLTAGDRGRVTGVRVREGEGSGAERALGADLVVAATGRSARVPAWLEELGHGRPPESTMDIHLGYASRRYRLPAGAFPLKGILVSPRPGKPRGVALFAQENGGWLLTLAGFGADRPPSEETAFASFLETVAPPELLAALREGEPLGEIAHSGTPTQRRRHYERMRRFPAGLLPIGDAICSFDPLYGQGMSVAALEALELCRCLRHGERGLRRRYLRGAARVVGPAWQMATGADLALPEIEGKRPLAVRMSNAYVGRLQELAVEDGEAATALGRVAGMLERPSHLMRPPLAWRVLRRRSSPPWPAGHLRTPLRRRTLRVGEIATPLREAGPREAGEAAVFLHGVPGSGADFEPLLAATGATGRALAWDAPGFGGAGKPSGFEQSPAGQAGFLDRALEVLGVERAHLVLHDFGGAWGLRWATERPGRVASVTLICAGAAIGYRWHRMARLWRTPLLGELAMATSTRAGFRAGLRRAGPRPLPRPLVDRMFDDFDRETRASILRLYRSVDDPAALGRDLADALAPARHPALVIWGERDPYLPADLAERQREAFPDAEIHVLAESGHWPFVDRADRVEELLLRFLGRVRTGSTAAAAAAAARSDDGMAVA